MAMGQMRPQTRGEPVEPIASRGTQQANSLANSMTSAQGANGALSAYMAARGATPIGGMGTTVPQPSAGTAQLKLMQNSGQMMLPPTQGLGTKLAPNPAQPTPSDGGAAAMAKSMGIPWPPPQQGVVPQVAAGGAKPGMPNAALPPRPTPPTGPGPQKGRTTSMQRRGVGVGMPPGQQPALKKKGGGGILAQPVTPMQAANDFLTQSKKPGVIPTAQPAVTAGPVSNAQPAPLNTAVSQ